MPGRLTRVGSLFVQSASLTSETSIEADGEHLCWVTVIKVTFLAGRIFGAWTLLASLIRGMASYNIHDPL